MIKSILLENFRTHKKTKLDFVPGVNIIKGIGDSGKTNIIRAILWTLTNRPMGRRMISDLTDGDASVTIEFDDKTSNGRPYITLRKGKKAEYVIGASNFGSLGDIEILKAVGSDVPDVVSDIANMGDINIQKQLDKPYLICSSPSEVSRVFNQIMRVEKVDSWISKLTTMINSASKEIRNTEVNIETTEQAIKNLGDIEQMEKDYGEIWKLKSKLLGIDSQKITMSRLLFSIEETEKEIKKTGKISDKAEEELGELIALQALLDVYESKIEDISDIVKSIEQNETAVKIGNTNLMKEVKEFKSFLKEVKVCPNCSLCKTDISKHNFDDILKGLEL